MELSILNLKELEIIAIKQALDKYKNLNKNYIKTVAKELGIGRSSLYRKLHIYNINVCLRKKRYLKLNENKNGI